MGKDVCATVSFSETDSVGIRCCVSVDTYQQIFWDVFIVSTNKMSYMGKHWANFSDGQVGRILWLG